MWFQSPNSESTAPSVRPLTIVHSDAEIWIGCFCQLLCRTSGHKNQCIPANMLNSQEIAYSDKVSTLRQMKRSPEEFEIVFDYPQLGKGSFGAVRLVRDKSNSQLYAMKIVDFLSEYLDEQERHL